MHSSEIRIVRNDPAFFSYRDSQGFRGYTLEEAYLHDTEKGEKLKVKALKARIFHYSYSRHRLLHEIEKLTGWRIGEYRNYKLVK